MKEITTQNNFVVLSNPKEQVPSVLEEGEVPQSQDHIQEENKESTESNIGSLADRHSHLRKNGKKKETYSYF